MKGKGMRTQLKKICSGWYVQICIMKKNVDEFLNLHSKQIVGEEALSHQKAHLCTSTEEVKITTEKRVT